MPYVLVRYHATTQLHDAIAFLEITNICVVEIINLLGNFSVTGIYGLLYVYRATHHEDQLSCLERELGLQSPERIGKNVSSVSSVPISSRWVPITSGTSSDHGAKPDKSSLMLTISHHEPPAFRPIRISCA